jgi:hypothetical protein
MPPHKIFHERADFTATKFCFNVCTAGRVAEWLKAPDSKLKNDLFSSLVIFSYHHKNSMNIGDFAFELCSRLVYLSGKKAM